MNGHGLDKRPLPTREDALAYAREMVPKAKWPSISIAEGGTQDGGDGLLLKESGDCWIIGYDPSPTEEVLEERLWVEKATGVVAKMVLED